MCSIQLTTSHISGYFSFKKTASVRTRIVVCQTASESFAVLGLKRHMTEHQRPLLQIFEIRENLEQLYTAEMQHTLLTDAELKGNTKSGRAKNTGSSFSARFQWEFRFISATVCKCLTKAYNTDKVENDSFLNPEACVEVVFWCAVCTVRPLVFQRRSWALAQYVPYKTLI